VIPAAHAAFGHVAAEQGNRDVSIDGIAFGPDPAGLQFQNSRITGEQSVEIG
jgi:hypothetical protein